MKPKGKIGLLSLFIISLLFAMSFLRFTPEETTAQLQLPPGVKREETVIYDPMNARFVNPYMRNWYSPATGAGQREPYHALLYDYLWDINTTTGEFINVLARAPPEELAPHNGTRWRIYLREGIYWTDGVEFTAEDVVFTLKLLNNTPGLNGHDFVKSILKDAVVVNKYTVDLEFKRPFVKLQEGWFGFGVVVWGCFFTPLPKHIWEKVENPLTFENTYPVGTGAYVVKDFDPEGYWILFERREDWWRSPVGQMLGMPKPKWILAIYYGPEEKKVMAMIRHELDFSTDISPEAWFTLKRENPYARAWYPYYPYGWFDDPCERGINFNLLNYPYNITQVRWALALAVNITEASISLYDGMLRMSPLIIPPIQVFMDNYFWPLEPWLRDFELPFDPGYKPFDPEPPVKIARYLKNKYPDEPIPTDEKGARELFGIGWWKYDPDEAAKLLYSVGFTRDSAGNWYLPTGERWSMVIIAPGAYEYESMRLAFVIADQWRRFGIDASVQTLESGPFWTYYSRGEYDAGAHWPGCGQIIDLYSEVQDHASWFIVPTGEVAPGNAIRWNNTKIDELILELEKVPPNDYDRLIPLGMEYLKTGVIDMPHIPMFGTTKIVPCDTYYWENLPTADNAYAHPIWWWSAWKFQLPMYKPRFVEWTYETIYIVKDTPKFKGVDDVYYGPFEVGDAVRVPSEDAKRLLAEGFASYTPPAPGIPEELLETIRNLQSDISTLRTNMTELNDKIVGLESRIVGIETITSVAYAAIALSVISILISVISLMKMRTRRE
jgi:peptide/nickel transport system substrate-binding protein